MNSRDISASDSGDGEIRDAAARWIVRRDRGFSERDTAEFGRWLKADPRHAAAVARSEQAWRLLDRLPPMVARPAKPRPRRVRPRWLALGGLAAAILAGVFLQSGGGQRDVKPRVGRSAPPSAAAISRSLVDGTLVRLSPGSVLFEEYTAKERRVRLVNGEGFFTVTKDTARPFIVEIREVTVRAVGTAFHVRLEDREVDVLVTEGTVVVKPAAAVSSRDPAFVGEGAPTEAAAPYVVAGQRAVVSLTPPRGKPAIVISEAPAAELATARAWGEPFLRLGGATLAELTAEFQRRTGTRVILADPALADLRLGGRFPSDDIEGFLRILATNYEIESKRSADGALILGKGP